MSPTLGKWLAALDRELWVQQRDPVAFFQRIAQVGGWRVLWPTRLLVIVIGVLLLPWIDYLVRGDRWGVVATVLALCGLAFINGFVMIFSSPIGGLRAGVWLTYLTLYHLSLPQLVMIGLCALAPLPWLRVWGGWALGLPLLVGISLVDTGALLVYQSALHQRERRARLRQGGPPADLPELSRHRLAGIARWLLAALLSTGALVLWWIYGQEAFFVSLALWATAVGCIRLESTLLAAVGWPLVYFDDQQQRWRATYVGRTALWVPPPALKRQLAVPAAQAAEIILGLFQESCLGLCIQRHCRQRPLPQLQPILLQLSLQEGGAAILTFLGRRLATPAARRLVAQYALLASEAAKPMDLQRWLWCLPTKVDAAKVDAAAEPEEALMQRLGLVRSALLQYQAQPVMTEAYQALQPFVHSLALRSPDLQDVQTHASKLAWPLALFVCLEEHQRQLTPRNGTQ
ncbi:MAG: hypothetical protein KF832_19065 [Caldilineaceae bacterium]|nr:hypothetical protein [Caldilineaceae bacterium]